MTTRQPYPTDLSEKEWALSKHLVPEAKSGGRPEEDPQREILNAIFSLRRSGCSWRMLPRALPPWRIIYDDFRPWRQDGPWQLMHDLLRGEVRVAAGKHRPPSAARRASQSVKTTDTGGSVAMRRGNKARGASTRFSSIRWG